ncbi:DUF2934 domain-containing protein [Crocosphaera sp. Alani8]|uniref:DUF2934 domain-containing protein n=1 Tax=Crocosphaera sp. Alani8 TaxID=3038952 RepID=UPI00313D8F05
MRSFRLPGSQNNNSLETEIEQRAYELWEEAGRQDETFDYYYQKAKLEREIQPTAYELWEEAGKPKGELYKYSISHSYEVQ